MVNKVYMLILLLLIKFKSDYFAHLDNTFGITNPPRCVVLDGRIIGQVCGWDQHLDLFAVGGLAVGGRGHRGRALGHSVDGGSATEEIRAHTLSTRCPTLSARDLNLCSAAESN